MFKKNSVNIAIFVLLCINTSYAAHPLVTDDAGTQGKRNFQIELNSEFSRDKEANTDERCSEFEAVLSCGLIDNIDVVIGVPYQWIKVEDNGHTVSDVNGTADTSIELKYRFYENNDLSFALKPGISFPTGDDEKGLGAGKTGYSLFFITTDKISNFAFHLNLGYIRNENKADERNDIWHISFASELELIKNLKAVVNAGVERNSDRNSDTPPAFVLGGIIYSILENLDIDCGVKLGLNKPETDYSVLAGLAFRL